MNIDEMLNAKINKAQELLNQTTILIRRFLSGERDLNIVGTLGILSISVGVLLREIYVLLRIQEGVDHGKDKS